MFNVLSKDCQKKKLYSQTTLIYFRKNAQMELELDFNPLECEDRTYLIWDESDDVWVDTIIMDKIDPNRLTVLLQIIKHWLYPLGGISTIFQPSFNVCNYMIHFQLLGFFLDLDWLWQYQIKTALETKKDKTDYGDNKS